MRTDLSFANYLAPAGSGFFSEAILIGCLILLCALAAGSLVRLWQKVQRIEAGMRSGEKNTKNLAFELEAQALLARQMSIDLEELRKRVGEQKEAGPGVLKPWGSAEMPVNLNRRGQIIRLSRKGKSVAEIAQDLNVAQGEVELLLKVHDLSHGKTDQ